MTNQQEQLNIDDVHKLIGMKEIALFLTNKEIIRLQIENQQLKEELKKCEELLPKQPSPE